MFSNPYHGKNLWGFLLIFIQRIVGFFTGQLSFQDLASDEIQVFVLMGVAISSALVGTFLVLRRMTMLANSLSHTILMGIVFAYFLSMAPASADSEQGAHAVSMQMLLLASLFMGLLTTFLTEFLTKTGKLQEDASTGIVFTSLFALGVILVTMLTRDAHIGTEAVMGNADALHRDDLFWVYVIAGLNLFLFILFFKEFKLTTFDPGLAYALGFSPLLFQLFIDDPSLSHYDVLFSCRGSPTRPRFHDRSRPCRPPLDQQPQNSSVVGSASRKPLLFDRRRPYPPYLNHHRHGPFYLGRRRLHHSCSLLSSSSLPVYFKIKHKGSKSWLVLALLSNRLYLTAKIAKKAKKMQSTEMITQRYRGRRDA